MIGKSVGNAGDRLTISLPFREDWVCDESGASHAHKNSCMANLRAEAATKN